jgi:hypothetical protein
MSVHAKFIRRNDRMLVHEIRDLRQAGRKLDQKPVVLVFYMLGLNTAYRPHTIDDTRYGPVDRKMLIMLA